MTFVMGEKAGPSLIAGGSEVIREEDKKTDFYG